MGGPGSGRKPTKRKPRPRRPLADVDGGCKLMLKGTQSELFPLQTVRVPPSAKWAELCFDAVIQADKARSENTKLTYLTQFENFVDWCAKYEVREDDVFTPEVLVSHLEWLKQAGYSRATISLRRTVICAVDQRMRKKPGDPEPHSLNHHPLVVSWWKGYARENPASIGRAPYVGREELRKVLRAMFEQTKWRVNPALYNARDRAIVLLGYLGAFRRSELSQINIGDLTFESGALTVRWRTSKTDALSLGEERVIMPQEETELCAIDALQRWLAVYRGEPLFQGAEPEPNTPLFPSIVNGRVKARRMPDTQIYQRIVAIAKYAGIAMSPHSLRAAFATHALEHSDEGEVAFHGRWKSRTTMQPYVRRSRSWAKNPTKKLK